MPLPLPFPLLLPLLFLPIQARSPCRQVLPDFSANFLISLHDPLHIPSLRCAGALISPTAAITTASCGVSRGWFALLHGADSINATKIRIKRVLRPPELIDFDASRDIGVVQFFQPVQTEGVGFAQVNKRQRLPFVEAYARWIGFTANGKRREVDSRVIGNEECKREFEGSDVKITREVVCVEGGVQRDIENGVLVQYEEGGRGVLMGVLSGGDGERGGVFGRVSRVKRWLRRVGGNVEFSGKAEQVFERRGVEGGGEWGGGVVGVVVLAVGMGVAGVIGGVLWGLGRRVVREDSSSESSVDYVDFLRKEEGEKARGGEERKDDGEGGGEEYEARAGEGIG